MEKSICEHGYVDTNNNNRLSERIELGTTTAGIVLDITKKGIEINGYYLSSSNSSYKGNLRKPIEISWDNLNKIRENLGASKNNNYTIDYELSKEYIDTLPKVHINDKMYFIDINRKEIRPCERPHLIYKMNSVIKDN